MPHDDPQSVKGQPAGQRRTDRDRLASPDQEKDQDPGCGCGGDAGEAQMGGAGSSQGATAQDPRRGNPGRPADQGGQTDQRGENAGKNRDEADLEEPSRDRDLQP